MLWTIISGTNRPYSNTLRVSQYLSQKLKSKLSSEDRISLLNLLELPQEIFMPSSYQTKPPSFKKFQDQISNTHALICVIPEYNGSAPGVFKYFIDMLSFPDSLYKKPVAFVGVSDGRFGALRAVEQMQQVFLYRNAFLYPESLYIKEVGKSLDAHGGPTDPFIQQVLEQMLDGFIQFARKFQ